MTKHDVEQVALMVFIIGALATLAAMLVAHFMWAYRTWRNKP